MVKTSLTNSSTSAHIPANEVTLEGDLIIPQTASAIILFAHGSGSSRKSPRNTFVAKKLNDAGLATLLFDLLTETEDTTYETRFDIGLLTERLVTATKWTKQQPHIKGLSIGYFGASTGAAAALTAAAQLDSTIGAVVSRGGRPDLAMEFLPEVTAPTLLIIGGNDDVVIELNQKAFTLLKAEKEFKIIPGATHLFEEPGALEEVARLAAEWFKKHLVNRGFVLLS